MLRTIKTGLPHRWQVAVHLAVSMDDDGSIPALTDARDDLYLAGSSAAVGVCYPASEYPRTLPRVTLRDVVSIALGRRVAR